MGSRNTTVQRQFIEIHRSSQVRIHRLSEVISTSHCSTRIRCSNLLSFVLSDGPYYEGTKANFERAERLSVVRTTTMYQTSIIGSLNFFHELNFN